MRKSSSTSHRAHTLPRSQPSRVGRRSVAMCRASSRPATEASRMSDQVLMTYLLGSRRSESARADDLLLDVAEPVLAEVHLAPDEERRDAEGAALDGRLRVGHERVLHLLVLRTGHEAVRVEPRLHEGGATDLGVVH